MQGYNLIGVLSADGGKLLMCRRKKEPYLGLFNLVGGKIKPGEDNMDAAYRELFEETSITREDLKLIPLMDFSYPLTNCYEEVYVGRLRHEKAVYGDENTLFWSGLDENFFDMNRYAGEGNIGHMVEQMKLNRALIWEEET